MSDQPGNCWKEIVRGASAVAVALAVFGLCKPSFFENAMREGKQAGLFAFAGLGDGESIEQCDESEGGAEEVELEYSAILSMPSCVDLNESIRTLQQARNALSKATLDDEPEAVRVCTREYHRAAEEVRTRFAVLKKRVGADDFPSAAEELLTLCAINFPEGGVPFGLDDLGVEHWQ